MTREIEFDIETPDFAEVHVKAEITFQVDFRLQQVTYLDVEPTAYCPDTNAIVDKKLSTRDWEAIHSKAHRMADDLDLVGEAEDRVADHRIDQGVYA